MRLFSNRSQMTSKCGKNKKVAHEAIAECVTDVLTTFSSVIYYWTDARQHGIYLFYIIIKKRTTTDKAFFNFESFAINRKPASAHYGALKRKAIWRKLLSIQNAAISLVAMRSNELWLVQENHATVKRDSRVASRQWNENLSKSRIELQNLQILKKILEKSKQFLPSEQSFEPESLDVPVKIAGVEKIRSENLQLWSTWKPFDSSFEWLSVTGSGYLCPLWLVILKSVWNRVGDTF